MSPRILALVAAAILLTATSAAYLTLSLVRVTNLALIP